jgi:serine/threonine-protein kinase RsbW
MAGPGDGLEVLRITTEFADLARLYPWLDDAGFRCGVPKPLLQSMQVVAEEAVMNVAMHAYVPGSQGEVIVRLKTQADTAVLVVEDTGPPFDPVAAPEKPRAKDLIEAPPGGLGLKLLRHYCKDISYARTNELNQLTMRFPY